MTASIHQPHYFPWIGYFDKMAKADQFVLLDQVQLEKGSQMIRNRIIDNNGAIKYITISAETGNFLEKEYRKISTKDVGLWTKRQLDAMGNYYRKAPAFSEILPIVREFLSHDYQTVCECTCASISVVRDLLDIDTPIIMQSDIAYDHRLKKSDLVRAICNAIGADVYFSGRGGSVGYLDPEDFVGSGVRIVFQDFSHPVYPQLNTREFIPGVSILDMLFNCGVENTKKLFWENVSKANEFGA